MKKRIIVISSIISVFIVICIAFFVLLTWNNSVVVIKVTDTNQISDKIKNVIKGSGSIDLSESDLNAVLIMNSKNINKSIKEIYAKIINNKLHIYMKINYGGINFFAESEITPKCENDYVLLNVDSLKVGKIKVPDFITTKILNSFKSKGFNLSGKTIKISNKILFFEVKSINIDNNIIRLTLKTEPVTAQIQKGNGNTGTTGTVSKDQKIALLKNTNSQLYKVRDAVQSQQAKNWVSNVMSINASMVSNPDGNYTSRMNAAKNAYNSLPAGDRNDIKTAALFNMDTSAVRFLASSYGLMN